MNAFLEEYGYLVLFLLVLAERAGLPLPAIPILVGAGALVRSGSMNAWTVLFLSVAACLLADVVWFQVGRVRGAKVMRWICRISLEPDSCVRGSERAFARLGVRSLLLAKFLPPLSVAAVPMAGMLRTPAARFLLFDTLGSVIWVTTFTALGYAFHEQLDWLLAQVGRLGAGLASIAAAALLGYVLWRWYRRQRFLRELRGARIPAGELHRRLRAGEEIAVVDLRHAVDFHSDPRLIPGALHIPMEELEARIDEIPRDREIALYCT